jgi:hypothetical protein
VASAVEVSPTEREVFLDLRKRMIWVGGLTLATAIIQLVSVRRESAHREETDKPSEYLKRPSAPTAPNAQAVDPPAAPVGHVQHASVDRVRARATRDALRAKIIDAQRSEAANREPSVPAQPSAKDDPTRPAELKNRIAGHDALVAHLNHDFMPLAHECLEQAQARSPSLRGMLTLQLETVSDERLGALVERAEVPAASEVQERELAECIRENAMTLTFPPSLPSGPDKFEFTLQIEPSR